MQEFIDSLSLPYEGEMKGNTYTMTLSNSNEFSKVFSLLDDNKDLELSSGDTVATESESLFRFTDGFYEVTASADYDNDVYSITVEEK